MIRHLSFQYQPQKLRDSAVAGSTPITDANPVDFLDGISATFVAHLGTLSAGQQTYLKLQHSDVVDSGYEDIPDARTAIPADTESNKTLTISITRPLKRFVKPVLVRGTGNAGLNSIFAYVETRYKPAPQHVTQAAPTVFVDGNRVIV